MLPYSTFSLIPREELRHLIYDLGKSDAEIAQLYRVSTNVVNQRRRLMNLMDGQMTAEQLANRVRLAEEIKHLPPEAVEQIQEIVLQYRGNVAY
ncbi:hypothetical protein [Alicyclobacillus dauci]|uniref:Uncharacterized protein n=1 Tax=Alicyclobacillus dauci TaxID=1475485 RepID=A0ABY6Z7M2_9BACL|nr:hypothetical protein [Alicyclobacillus dauci]WAH38903.1 hypothetical protein NZD86_10690 [Alicyclobacillus dauci]